MFGSSPSQDSIPDVTSSATNTTPTEIPSTVVPSFPNDPPLPRRNPPRDHQPPARHRSCLITCYSPELVPFLVVIHFLQEPKSNSETIKYPEWKQGMDELRVFHHTHTCDFVPLPYGDKPVSCKWIYKIKTQSDGSIE